MKALHWIADTLGEVLAFSVWCTLCAVLWATCLVLTACRYAVPVLICMGPLAGALWVILKLAGKL